MFIILSLQILFTTLIILSILSSYHLTVLLQIKMKKNIFVPELEFEWLNPCKKVLCDRPLSISFDPKSFLDET